MPTWHHAPRMVEVHELNAVETVGGVVCSCIAIADAARPLNLVLSIYIVLMQGAHAHHPLTAHAVGRGR